MAFVPRDHVHFIAFDFPFQRERLLAFGDPLAEPRGHLASLRDRQIQFRGDLLVGQVESQKMRTQHPHA